MNHFTCHRFSRRFILIVLALLASVPLMAQDAGVDGRVLYDTLKKFELKGKASVSGLALKRDRAEMTFTGDFYFAAPVDGKITGAVFVGSGTFKAAAPEISYEQESMQRFLNSTTAESDFKTAVLRFSDDTLDIIGKGIDAEAAAPLDAQKLALELESRLLKETGANISARLTISLANRETPGVFFAQFDKGKLGRFSYLVDMQARIPGSAFRINAGEKVLLFAYAPYAYTNDMLIATYAESDFAQNRVSYSDTFDLVNPVHYKMEIDLRDARKVLLSGLLRTKMRIDFVALSDNLRAIPMLVNDGLTEFDNIRRNKSMRVKSVQYAGQDIPYMQEDWETGLTFVLPRQVKKGEAFSVELALEGDFVEKSASFYNCIYLRSNESWYPRHGYLRRSTFNLLFQHDKNDKVASVGRLVREGVWPDTKEDALTEYVMDDPIALVAFAAGGLERHTEKRKLEFGEMDLEFYSVPSSVSTLKEEFVLAEFGNALEYFGKYFGPYPYGVFKGTVHPFNFGQGFPTLLLLAKADEANRAVFSFIAHETAHQWWGNIVAWRSYRDQWLSEGFAEYSGMLYTGLRYNMKAQRDLIDEARYQLPFPPETDRGVGKVKMAEIGPLILGHRLNSRNTQGVYQNLIYNKGALVLRMLHYLFSDPDTGSGQPFFDMMSDFVAQYKNQAATTEDFVRVAGSHFANAPLGKMLGLKDLDWFFKQWVFEAKLPSYRMEYKIESGEGGQHILTGTVFQDNAGPGWFMPLPVVAKFGDQKGRVTVYVNGPKTDFRIALPAKPSSVELDPDWWILSEKTSTKKK
ncbi:MAG: hypothetical protein LBP68_05715 [Acidobacteriota bacterium]|jgi:hypothetical protein|nr:hypothetical protein [Acidobacteriota bacterium]